jgi:fructose-1,6-bisphosphatase/inositol monophosphatase family enzyme
MTPMTCAAWATPRWRGRDRPPAFRQGPESWDKGAGQGPVSEADLEIDLMLRDRLLSARPGFGWLSEETEDDPARLAAPPVFIVDPIDGTRAFLEGRRVSPMRWPSRAAGGDRGGGAPAAAGADLSRPGRGRRLPQ